VGGRIVDIAVSADRLYLACLNQGVVVVDVRTPQRPHLLQRLPTTEAATGVAVHGQQVFAAAGALDVFDITRPATPQRTTNRRLQQAYGLALLPPYAVVASGSDGLQVVSMDGRGDIAHRPTGHYAARVTLTDTHAVIADTRGGIRLFDLAQPTQPRLVAAMEDIGTIVDVIVDGSVAYLADDRSRSGLVVVTISGHGAPYFIGQYHTESTTDVVVWQELAVLSDQAGLLHVVDVRQPSRPRLRDSLALPGKIQRLTLLPPYVLVASDEGGVHVVEVAPTGRLQHHKTLFPTGRALDIVVVDRTAYIAAVDGGIQTMDVSVPGRPTLGTPYHHPDGKGDHILRVVAYQDTLYAIDNQRGIQKLRRSGAGALQLLGRATVPRGAPWGLTAVGPYVFVTTLLHSLYVMDMTDPAQPHLLSTAPYGGTAVTAVDRLLYIAVRGYRGVPGGLRVMETFTPVSDHVLRLLQIRGVTPLPGLPPGTQLVNHAYTFHTPAVAASIALSPPDVSVPTVRLHVRDYWGVSGKIRYQLSNDGGIQWHPVQPGTWHRFPEPGTELRWRALLEATNPLHTPVIEMLRIDYPAPEQVPQHTTP
jgi:hypothetical protein